MKTTKKAPFTKGEINLMVKYGIDGFNVTGPRGYVITNHFGVTVPANEFEVELYRQTMIQYSKYEAGDFSAVRDFDRLKYLFLKVNPEAYYDLID